MAPRDAYALTGAGRVVALRALVGLTGTGAEERTTWIHVGYEGTWEGHPEGAFTLTADDFRACAEDFGSQVNPTVVDYEHASLYPHGEPVPAAGFVQDLQVRGSDLWARVEFTARAADLIRAGEYRYCSGVFRWAAADRKTGEERRCVLDSIALTNRPFIDGQRPIALSSLPSARVVPLTARVLPRPPFAVWFRG